MSNKPESFSSQLLAAGGPSKDRHEQERMLRELIDNAARFERKLERLLKFTWAITTLCIVVLAICFMILRTEQGQIVEIARMILLLASAIGGIGLTMATMSTLAWLFRSRSVSLSVIERRLASMEQSLASLETDRRQESS